MALDKVGDCFIAGDYIDASNDAVIIKYTSTGSQDWINTYQGPASAIDYPAGITADSVGNSYVTLLSGDNFGPYDIVTIKYNPLGTQQWIKIYDSGNDDEPFDMTMDNQNNIYIAGISDKSSLIIKYKPNGDTLWTRKYTLAGYSFPVISITVDFQNNVIIGSNKINTTNGGQEYFTMKYDSNGVFQWIMTTSFNALTGLNKVAADNNGNIFATGHSLGGKIVTLKYNSSGVLIWQKIYDGPNSAGDRPNDMKIDRQGNVIITGSSPGIGAGNNDYITIKYNPNGDSLWVNRYNGNSNDNDEAYSLDLDDSDNIYITGRSINPGTSWDYVSIKYISTGLQAWIATY